jgi:hypothetical protein
VATTSCILALKLTTSLRLMNGSLSSLFGILATLVQYLSERMAYHSRYVTGKKVVALGVSWLQQVAS